MGQPAAFLTVNGIKRHNQRPAPRPGEPKTSAQRISALTHFGNSVLPRFGLPRMLPPSHRPCS